MGYHHQIINNNTSRSLIIENEDSIQIITRYDYKAAFHFVDRPYISSDRGRYAGSFNDEDFLRLLETLTQIKGKFILTMFPHDKIQEFANLHKWKIHKIERTISASKTSRRR